MMLNRYPAIASAVCSVILVASGGTLAAAQEHEEQHHAEAGAAEHEEHEFHRHHVSVSLGVTDGEVEVEGHAEVGVESAGETAVVEDELAFTMGLDYEYRLSRRWGIGALIDYAGGDLRSWVAGVPLFLHPGGGWKLVVAPGYEDKEGEDREFLVRVGAGYDFEVGGFSVLPSVQVDFVGDEETPVYGLNIGRGF